MPISCRNKEQRLTGHLKALPLLALVAMLLLLLGLLLLAAVVRLVSAGSGRRPFCRLRPDTTGSGARCC